MINDLNVLVENINQWGVDRNISAEGGASIQAQISKGMEEMAEAISTLDKLRMNQWHLYGANAYDVDQAWGEREVLLKQLRDDIGDIVVCMIQAARLADTNLIECLNQSWDDIKERKGYMKDGKFIKINEEIL